MLGAAKTRLLRAPALLARLVNLYALRHGCRVRYEADRGRLTVRNGRREIRVAAAHAAYAVDLVREFDLYFGAVAPRTEGEREVCDFSAPRRHAVPALGVELTFASLPEAVDTGRAYLEALGVEPGHVVLDAGAYCGLTAFLFSRAVGAGGRVVAVEADPGSYACLEANLAALELPNVTPVHAALWKEPGRLRFSTESNLGSAVVDLAARRKNTVEVRAVTMNDLAVELGLERVDRVKMDIEGAEYDVLTSSADFVARFRPTFVVEVHRDRRGRVDIDGLSAFFRSLRYETTTLKQAERERFPLLRCTPS